jgi:hypothetical protein
VSGKQTLAMLVGLAALGAFIGSVLGATGPSKGFQKIDPNRVTAQGYIVNNVDTAYRTSLSSADSPTLTNTVSIAAITTIYCGGWQNVVVSGVHSTASATVKVHVYRCSWDGTTLTVRDMSTATLTADATYTTGTASQYLSVNSSVFDTEGADIVKVLIEAPSAGSVSLWAGVF